MNFYGEHLLSRRDALARGATDAEIKAALARREIAVVRRGIYVPAAVLESLDATGRHLLEVRATLLASAPAAAAAHGSAALVHGMSLWRVPERVHLGIPRSSGGHVGRHRHVHADGLTERDVDVIDGLRCTSAARTVADLARTLPFEDAVCAGDSALNRHLVTPESVRESLSRTPSHRRRTAAECVLGFLDGRSESVGESRSRVYLHHLGVPCPELQVTLMLSDGRTTFRPDFLWEDEGVIGEFDGVSKYSALARPGESPADVLVREKRREDLLRAHGWTVVRWTWADLTSPRLGRELRRVLSAGCGVARPRTTRVG